MAFGEFGLTGGATAERAALRQQFRPGCAVDGAIHPAPAQQRRVGGIDDDIHLQFGNSVRVNSIRVSVFIFTIRN